MNEVEMKSQIKLEELFPVSDLEGNKSLMNKFIREVKHYHK